MKELVGNYAPLRSSLDIGAKALKRKVGTGAEFLKELMALPGVKPTELKERGLEALMNEPKMTHQEFLRHLMMKPAPRLQEKVLSGVNDDHIQKLIEHAANDAAREEFGRFVNKNSEEYENFMESFIDDANNYDWNKYRDQAHELEQEGMLSGTPHHEEWTLPGGENYREMLIKKPGKDVFAVPQHYNDEPNIIASMRLKDRAGPNGEKLLHLEELQSDWHQQGREKGYGKDIPLPQDLSADELFKKYHKRLSPAQKAFLANLTSSQKRSDVLGAGQDYLNKVYQNWLKDQKTEGVPDVPFKKNWEEMAIKRLIHHAAEKGYHGIVMTPGHEQAKRYSLSKHINDLQYDPDTKTLHAWDHHGDKVVHKSGIDESDLHEYIGKEGAEKLLAKTPKDTKIKQLFGADLEVGGEGMKGFYDKKVPNIFNAVGKKHGVKMELHGHPIEKEPANRLQVGEMVYEDPAKIAHLHHFPITEPMRQDVLKNGLPLYNHGGIVHKAEGGNVQPSIEQMRMALNQNRFMVPKGDIQSIGANEAPSMPYKLYVEPGKDGSPAVGGVDMNKLQPGMQLMKQDQPAMTPQGGQPPQGGSASNPLGGAPSNQLGGAPSNILQMTPQGQALGAMTPPQQPQQPQGLAKGGQPKKPTVEQMKQAIFAKAQEGLSKPSEILGKHEGKYLHLTEADRAKVEKRLNGMRGGVGFSQIGLENPEYMRRVWGVGKPGTATKLLNRQAKGLSPEDQAIWSTFIGTPEMHTSNQLVFNRMWNKFQEARKQGKLSPELEAKMLDIMRSAMTKATKKSPAKPIFDPDVSFDNTHHLFDTFERRRILANLMAGNQIGGKKGQIFDASKMIEDTTDPKLLHAPSMSVGPHLFTMTGETSYEPHLNKAFPHMLHGETSPDTFQQIPFEHAAPEFVQQIMEEKGRKPGYMDIVRRIPRQHISEKYLTNLQKMGYKKGGKVKESLDTMQYALSKKTKKAK
jgi:hypothetical protein